MKFKKGDMVMYRSNIYTVGGDFTDQLSLESYISLYPVNKPLQHPIFVIHTMVTPFSLKYYYSTLNPSLLSRILPSKKNIKLLFYLLTLPIITLFLYISILLKGSTWARGVHHLTWGGGSKKGGGLTNVS